MNVPGDAAGRKARTEIGAPPIPAGLAVTDRDFLRFQGLIHREAGIWLSPVKKALLVGRLAQRLRELELALVRRVLRPRRRRRGRADPDARLHLHQRDPLLPRAAPLRVPHRARVPGAGGRPPTRGTGLGGSASGAPRARPARSRTPSRWCCSRRSPRAGSSRSWRPTSRRRCSIAPPPASGPREGEGDPGRLPESLHAEGLRRARRAHEGRPRDPRRRPLRPRQPGRRRAARRDRRSTSSSAATSSSTSIAPGRSRSSSGCSSGSTPAGYLFLGHAESLGGFTTRARPVVADRLPAPHRADLVTMPIHVLVVDDSAVVRQALLQILGRVGHDGGGRERPAHRDGQDAARAAGRHRARPRDAADGRAHLPARIMAEDPIPVVVCSGLAGPGHGGRPPGARGGRGRHRREAAPRREGIPGGVRPPAGRGRPGGGRGEGAPAPRATAHRPRCCPPTRSSARSGGSSATRRTRSS